MARLRTVLGFLVGPLMTPVTFAVGGSLAFGGSHELSWAEYTLGAFLLTGPYAYIVTLFLGVPGYYFLRSKGWLKAGILSLAGALLGLLTAVIVGYSRFVPLVILCVVSGLVSALCFWLIVCWQPNK
jgi:hypothetical protein